LKEKGQAAQLFAAAVEGFAQREEFRAADARRGGGGGAQQRGEPLQDSVLLLAFRWYTLS